MDKKFNFQFLETARIRWKTTVPRPIRPIIIPIMIGTPIMLVIAVWQSIYTWWSITLFIIYFGISGLSFADWLMGKRHQRIKTPRDNDRG